MQIQRSQIDTWRWLGRFNAVVPLLVLAGCSLSRVSRDHERFSPISFPSESNIPHVVVLGNLAGHLPHFDTTSALDRFLYGPNDDGKTIPRHPQGMGVFHSRLYVCDQGHPDIVSVDLATGKSLLWCEYDRRPRCPVDVTVDPRGAVFVADSTGERLLRFDLNGHLIEELVPPGAQKGMFRPCAVCVFENVLYVANVASRCVDRYDTIQRHWLDSLRPDVPEMAFIAPAGIGITDNGLILISDALAGRIHRVTTDGEWLQPFGRPGRAAGELIRPKQVGVTPGGLILVVDAGRQSVVVYDQEGRFITEVHERAGAWQGWVLPMGLMVLPWSAAESLGLEADPVTDCYVLVSDSLGGWSLTLLQVVTGTTAEEPDVKVRN